MEVQAQESQASPQQQDSAPQPSVADLNAAAFARQQEVFAKARAALREARGVPAPEAVVAPPVVTATPAATPPTPAPQNPAQPALDAAETFRREALRVKADADARVAAAEAKVAQQIELARKKPVEWLKANGYPDLDAWNARLLNGGELSPTEVLAESVDARVKAAEDRAAKAEQAVQQFVHTQRREAALTQLTPAIQKEFPLVAHFMGPDAALDALTKASQQAGKVLNPAEYFKTIENGFLEQYKAPLSNPQVASKLQLSVQPSPPSEVAAQSPKTLTNRVTSTVTPPSSRPMTDAERIARGREMIRKLNAAGQL